MFLLFQPNVLILFSNGLRLTFSLLPKTPPTPLPSFHTDAAEELKAEEAAPADGVVEPSESMDD